MHFLIILEIALSNCTLAFEYVNYGGKTSFLIEKQHEKRL